MISFLPAVQLWDITQLCIFSKITLYNSEVNNINSKYLADDMSGDDGEKFTLREKIRQNVNFQPA